MPKAILTRYVGPTNHNPAKIKVWAEQIKPLYIPLDDELSVDENMRLAAITLAQKHNWPDPHNLAEGGLPDNTGNVYCFAQSPVLNKADLQWHISTLERILLSFDIPPVTRREEIVASLLANQIGILKGKL